MNYLAGFLCISILLELILLLSRGRAIGGGDVKLMAAAGLLLGWKQIILAFLLGCIIGSVIHLLRMKLSGADRVLAMGPYLSAGIAIAALWGTQMLDWYLGMY
jgi:leader peptidase (prepilin peptidase)/N-methyltransferase